MKVEREQKRLKAIKLKYVHFPKRCSCCGEEFKREKMWQVYRYGINEVWNKFYYCQNCMHSAKDVLNEIDTDALIWGIAGVDDPICFKKKDYTRMNELREKLW